MTTIGIKIQAEIDKIEKQLKKLKKEASGAGISLDSVAKGARNTDRQLKGAAKASSNASKKFF